MAANAKPVILYDSRFNDGTPTATDTAAGYSVLAIKDLRAYTFWKGASSGTKYLTVDCGSAKTATALGIVGHNLYTAAATVSVECSSDNFATDVTVALAGFNPASDKAILKIFTTQTKRYWRLKIVTASVAAKVAVCMIGSQLAFERNIQGPNFDPLPEKLVSQSSISKTGHILGVSLQFVEITVNAVFKRITPSWITNTFKPAWDSHISLCKPFFWGWDITNHPDEILFAAVQDDFTLSMPYETVRRSLTLRMRGVKE